MFAIADQTADSIGLAQVATPGTIWAYNNPAIQVLEAVLRATVKDLEWKKGIAARNSRERPREGV